MYMYQEISFTPLPTYKHRVTALEDSTFIEVSTPFLEDVVRVEDDFNRK